MTERTLSSVRARPGNPREYRAVNVPGGVMPRVDAVEVYGVIDWMKDGPVAVSRLTPGDARRLAVELLTAAENVDEREGK